MLDDKLIDYISGIKSPFEEDEIGQENISYDGYMKYFRDCMIKSIGTNESESQFSSYWNEFISSCDEQQKEQFIKNLINRIIKVYKMSYLTSMLEQDEIPQELLIDLINFFVYKYWLKYFPKCLSYISENILTSESMIMIFITSDYNKFVDKLYNCKSCNILIREYFKYCDRNNGVKTLYRILKDDILSNFVEQYKLKK
jgi:hypothetical protein